MDILNSKVKFHFYGIVILCVISVFIFSFLHYIKGNLNKYIPFYGLTFLGVFISILYGRLKGDYIKATFYLLISISISIYGVFLYRGIGTTDVVWITTLISTYYILLPLKLANIGVALFSTTLLITVVLYFLDIIELPYRPLELIPLLINIGLLIYLGNISLRNVTKKLEELRIEARVDELTKIYNRKKILEELEKSLEKLKKENIPFSVLMLDIDRFKNINDTYGHQYGDEVLREFSRVISKNIRGTDIFGRLGGEEFLVILNGTNIRNAYKVAEKLRKEVEKGLRNIFQKNITVSIGVTEAKKDDTTESIIKRADLALYKAKSKGRNLVIAN